jgi:hypothetical protein
MDEITIQKSIRQQMSHLYYSLIQSNRLFFVTCTILVSLLFIDSALVQISTFLNSYLNDDQQFYIFAFIAISFIIGQHFILSFSRGKIKSVKSSWILPRSIHTVVIISYYILALLLLVILSEIFLNSSYNTFVAILLIIISYGISSMSMGLLAYRFFIWFRSKKSYLVLLYSISCSIFTIANLFVMIFASYIIPQRGSIIEPHVHIILYFNNPGSFEYILYNGYVICSVLSFVFFWLATAMVLRHYSKRIGRIKYWVIVCLPLVYFLTQFNPLLLNTLSALTAQDPFVFGIVVSIIYSVSKSIGGIVFALAFWFMAKKTNKNYVIRDFLILTATGFILLYVSEQAVALTSAPYPPFGITSVATVGLASYLILIGLHYSAISVSSDIRTRKLILSSAIKELDLLGNVGYAEMEKQLEGVVAGILRKHPPEVESPTENLSTERVKEYTKEVLDEIGRSSGHV